MAKAAVLNIDIVATAEKALGAFDKVKDKATSSFSSLKIGATVAAGAVLAGLGDATKAAAEHEVSVSKLTQAYKDAGVSTTDMGKSLEEIDASSRRTGQSTEDNIAAYTKLVTATKDTTKAHDDLAVAQDLAAFKGISVASAADDVVKAQGGQTRALKELGIATTDAAGKQLSTTQIMKNLTDAVHGQADAMGDTASGQMARYKESLDQTKVAVGEALLPVLKEFLNMLQPLFTWLANNQAILKVLAPIIAIVAGTILAVTTALRIWVAVQTVLNVVLSANPIGIVILAVAALIAIIVLAIRHWQDIRNVINDAWSILKDLGGWIMNNWQIIVDILLGPLGVFLTHLQDVKRAIEDVINALEDVGRKASDALGWLGKIPKGAGSIIDKLNPFSLAAPAGPAAATYVFQITATPGADLPEAVYQALRDYQRRHVRPELVATFGR
jgi:hypothetical protein